MSDDTLEFDASGIPRCPDCMRHVTVNGLGKVRAHYRQVEEPIGTPVRVGNPCEGSGRAAVYGAKKKAVVR